MNAKHIFDLELSKNILVMIIQPFLSCLNSNDSAFTNISYLWIT